MIKAISGSASQLPRKAEAPQSKAEAPGVLARCAKSDEKVKLFSSFWWSRLPQQLSG
jgi:hypothetical protein